MGIPLWRANRAKSCSVAFEFTMIPCALDSAFPIRSVVGGFAFTAILRRGDWNEVLDQKTGRRLFSISQGQDRES